MSTIAPARSPATGNTTQEIVDTLGRHGYCVVPGVIPADKVGHVRDEVFAAQRANHAQALAELEKTRSRGHRVGAAGVDNLRQVINETQCFAEHLSDPRILGVATELFGDFVRISCTDCVITNPGSARGYWHSDWPYNATNSTHVKAPYPDVLMHLSGIWMLTDFTTQNGGTFIVPGSHKLTDNPAGETLQGFDKDGPHPDQLQVTGTAGSVLLYDSRLWHAVAANVSDDLRVALIIRYAPWWLNLTPSIRGTPDHDRMVLATGGKNYDAVPMRREVFERLSGRRAAALPAFRHRGVADRPRSTTATGRASTSCRPRAGSRTPTARSITAGATTSSTSTTPRTWAPSAATPSGDMRSAPTCCTGSTCRRR